jgi:hypothetical protein
MVINLSKVKSEALLLFCRDLIESYKQNNEDTFDIDEDIKQFMDTRVEQLLKAINIPCQPIAYYIRNKQVSRIAMIIKGYDFINKTISKKFEKQQLFNPAMLSFTLLSTWFAELSKCEDDKEFLYFTRYPYGEIYDKLLLEIDNNEFKELNLSMLNIAEDTVIKLNNYRLK